jgi:hypothetical protein
MKAEETKGWTAARFRDQAAALRPETRILIDGELSCLASGICQLSRHEARSLVNGAGPVKRPA